MVLLVTLFARSVMKEQGMVVMMDRIMGRRVFSFVHQSMMAYFMETGHKLEGFLFWKV